MGGRAEQLLGQRTGWAGTKLLGVTAPEPDGVTAPEDGWTDEEARTPVPRPFRQPATPPGRAASLGSCGDLGQLLMGPLSVAGQPFFISMFSVKKTCF